jgi:putative ABC transport system ATP-binding protein
VKEKPVIALEKVWKRYEMGGGEVAALRGISLEVMPGEFVGIMGPSGSGKSTLMHLIGCLDYPSSGMVLLDGHDITHLSESDLAQMRGSKIGFVFQKFNLVNYLTAVDNVSLPLLFKDVERKERREIAATYLRRVGLEHRLFHRPNEMSGGEQQRVAIARALAGNPQLILADEPTGNLDSKTGTEIIDLLEELHHEGKTVVMVTHDASLSKRADRLIKIRDGELVKAI